MNTELAVVTGAFGYTGRYIAQRLLDQGARVKTLTGHPDRPSPFGDRVAVASLDFDDPDGLARGLDGADTLYNTYWIRFARGGVTFERAVENSVTLITAAERAGVRRIVHVSITNASAASPLPYFRGKGLVEAAVRASRLSFAIIRPTVVFGNGDILLNNIAWADRLSEVLLAPARIIPRVGRMIPYPPSIFKDFGVYEGKFFQDLVQGYLAQKGKHKYGDLLMPGFEDEPKHRYRLRVIASDLTARRMLILPDDIREFGMEPDELSIALSLRMSMSIPFFFEPVKLYNPNTKLTHTIVDGGMLSNYPIWLFDAPAGEPVEWPTLGFNIYEPRPKDDGPPDPFYRTPRNIANPIQFVQALQSTSFSAIDRQYISKRHWARTISISSVGVGSTDFDLTDQKKLELLESGRSAARSFLSTFDFERYKRTWRAGAAG